MKKKKKKKHSQSSAPGIGESGKSYGHGSSVWIKGHKQYIYIFIFFLLWWGGVDSIFLMRISLNNFNFFILRILLIIIVIKALYKYIRVVE